MTQFESSSSNEKLRVALYSDVLNICKEIFHHLGLEITKPAMIIIAELLFKKLSIYGSDLEAFANHANRTNINTDDVQLLVRRNPSLKAHLRSKSLETPGAVQKRRNTTPNTISKKRKIENPNNMNLPSTSRDRAFSIDTIE